MALLNESQQRDVSEQVRLPVDNVGTDAKTAITAEVVQLEYWNAGTLTTDAGQAAGVAVQGSLAYRNIKNAAGDMTGTYLDTSLSFTSTAFTTEVAFNYQKKEQYAALAGVDRLNAITEGFSNGDYCVDYRTGVVYGVKASNTVTLTATAYKVETNTSGSGGGGLATDVNVTKVGGVAVEADADGFIETVAKSYDSSTQSDRVAEVNPLNQQFVPEEQTFTNVANATPEYMYFDMNGYKYFALQGEETGGTDTVAYTVEATLQDDGTAQGSCTYEDVTNDWFGVVSYTSDFVVNKNTPTAVKYVRVKVTTAGAADDWDGIVRVKKFY